MKNILVSLYALLLSFSPIMTYSDQNAASVQSLTGIIIIDDIEMIEILPAKDKSKTVLIKVTADAYIADAVSGKPASLNERKNDKIVAYYKSGKTGDNEAVALIINIPEDYSPPVYARAVQVSRSSGQLYVLTNSEVIVTINNDTPIDPFFTRNIVTIDNITDDTDLLLWNQALNMSIPARTAANKAVILGKAKPEDPVKIMDRDLNNSASWQGGRFPQITGVENEGLQSLLNESLDQIYNEALNSRVNFTDKLSFSYKVKEYKSVTSVIIHCYLSAGDSNGDSVRTIVFNKDNMLTLQDVLGADAYEVAEEFVHQEIEKMDDGRFYDKDKDFQYVTDKTSFYIDVDGDPVIIYDKGSIAPGMYGTPELKIDLES